jgi:hypothetical protein
VAESADVVGLFINGKFQLIQEFGQVGLKVK